MKLDHHIATKLLTDKYFSAELIIDMAKNDGIELGPETIGRYTSLYHLLSHDNNKNYYVTQSVMDKLHLLDTKKCMDIEGWKLFHQLYSFKKTFILPDNKVVRVQKAPNGLYFCFLEFKYLPVEQRTRTIEGEMNRVLLFVDLENNKLAEHFTSDDGRRIAPFLYSLMCYVELCDNQEVIVAPKQKYGTKKTGNFINTLPLTLTVINNTWNVTTVRTDGFDVIGHSAIRWSGVGKVKAKLVFIEPFRKHGYKRKSGKELSK